MPTEKDRKPEASARKNRPNTIDLTATEIRTAPPAEPDKTAKAEAAKPEIAKAENVHADSKPEESAPGGDASKPAEEEIAGAQSASHEFPASATHSGNPWHLVGGIAAAVILFAVGLGAGYWLSLRDAAVTRAPATDPSLLERLGKIESALNAPRAQDPQLLARLAAAEAAVKTAADFMASRDRRADEVAALAQEARDRAAKATAAAEAAAKTARAASADQPHVDLEAFTRRIDALEALAKSNEAAVKANTAALARQAASASDDAHVRLATAVLALREAAERGEAFAAELTVVKSLLPDAKAVAAVEAFAAGGIPTADAMTRELLSLMPALWKAGARDSTEGSFLARLQANAERIVRVRPAGERAGDEPADVKARIEQRARAGDVRGALAELGKLPADARAPAQAWIGKAQAREAALAGARALSQNAVNALAKPGS